MQDRPHFGTAHILVGQKDHRKYQSSFGKYLEPCLEIKQMVIIPRMDALIF